MAVIDIEIGIEVLNAAVWLGSKCEMRSQWTWIYCFPYIISFGHSTHFRSQHTLRLTNESI